MRVVVAISTAEDTEEFVRSLCEWLNRDPDLNGTARLAPRSIRPGDLGAPPPDLIVESMAAATLLASVIGRWFRYRGMSAVVVKDGERVKLTIDRASHKDFLEALRAVLEESEAGDAGE